MKDVADRTYIAIDIKSFYASVECRARGLNPLTTNLVVADLSRTEKTICLAVSPSLKYHGISGRARLFEVVERVKELNADRLRKAPGRTFSGKSFDAPSLASDPALELDYIVATPRMSLYMETSTKIVDIYLKYVSMEDMHVYSVDEVFMDATDYIRTRGMSAHDFARMIVKDVLDTTGITATAGIGTNLYLCKIAMDIYAKRVPADADGVRIAELDEMSYREHLWEHKPITDFWRVGRGYAQKLAEYNMRTMGDVALQSVQDESLLYRLFGVNAELLIDHAWGWEPCTIKEIKEYRPRSNSLSIGQVLSRPYTFSEARIIIREMTEGLILDLVEKGLVTDQVVLTVGYDTTSLTADYAGPVATDWYGKKIPKQAHSSKNIGKQSSSTKLIMEKMLQLYDEIVDKTLLVRRMYVVANHVVPAASVPAEPAFEQLDLFTDYASEEKKAAEDAAAAEREKKLQKAMLAIKKKHGKNAILHGTSYQEAATGRERNAQIGGHKS